jgi:hypothetical protein
MLFSSTFIVLPLTELYTIYEGTVIMQGRVAEPGTRHKHQFRERHGRSRVGGQAVTDGARRSRKVTGLGLRNCPPRPGRP